MSDQATLATGPLLGVVEWCVLHKGARKRMSSRCTRWHYPKGRAPKAERELMGQPCTYVTARVVG